jgi:hypothetical protein
VSVYGICRRLRGLRPEEYRRRVAGVSKAGSCLSFIPSSQSPQLSKGRRSSRCGSSKAGRRWWRWMRRWGWPTSSRKDDAGGLEKDVLSASAAHQRNQYILPASFRHVSCKSYNYGIKSHRGKAYMHNRTTTE